jgi:hypothetical protein
MNEKFFSSKPIHDIKIVGPEDKIIIVPGPEQEIGPSEIKIVENFLKSKYRTLFIEGCEIYILRKGAKLLLKDVLNKKLKEIKK